VSDRRLRIAALVLAAIGLGIASYLTYVHYRGIAPVCSLGGDCERVQTSRWASLAGVPVALLGLLAYAAIVATLFVRTEEGLAAGALLALIGFGFRAYLTYRELFTIDAVCQWCVASAIVLTLLTVITMTRLVRGSPEA
jgi:uncharacterized membrane protein